MRFSALALAVVLASTACMAGDAEADSLRLSTPRAAHASIVLDEGRVLLLGGCVRNGCEAGPESATVDLYETSGSRIIPAGRLLSPRIGFKAAALPDGRVLVVGGWNGGKASADAEIFDPATGSSQSAGALTQTRGDISLVALADGRILIAGGFDGRRRLTGAEIFNPVAGTFTPVGPLNEPRSAAESVLLADGRVLIVGGAGGRSGEIEPLASAEIFDPATSSFTPTGSMAEARYKHAALRLPDGRVLVIAGSDARDREGKKQTVEIYDPAQGRFVPGGTLLDARYKLADAVVLLPDGRVLIAGGARHPEMYDPTTGTSRGLALDLGGSWNFMTAARLPNGRVLLAGGYNEDGLIVSDRAWLFAI